MDTPPLLRCRRQLTILIVDDDLDNLILLRHQVTLLVNCSIVSATDGHTALSLATSSPPDLILLDMMLPDMDGFEVARHLKQNPLTANIPVIGVSAMARNADQESALQAGCDDYVRKPYELESLEKVMYHHLSCEDSIEPTLLSGFADAS